MNAWWPLLGTLGWNYLRHRRGLSTICSATRRVLPPVAFLAGWAAFTTWMVRHILSGYDQKG